MKQLNLGCGKRIKEGYINIDRFPHKNVTVMDLDKVWTFKDNSIDHIHARNILEHVSDREHFMNEVHRVLKPNGTIFIRVPYRNCEMADTFHHKQRFALYWYKELIQNSHSGLDKGGFKLINFKSFPATRVKWLHIPTFIREFLSPMIGELTISTEVTLKKSVL